MKWINGLILLPFIVNSSMAQAGEEADILGVWTTANAKSVVEISQCDAGLCGRIISLKEEVYPADDKMAGQKKVDRNNPDESKQSNPIVGLQILKGFTFDGDDVWEDGEIYDPNNGKTYKCKMTMVDKNNLKVRGYIGFALLGRTTEWTR